MGRRCITPCLKQLLQWLAAGIAATLLVNIAMFGYYRIPGQIDRQNAATDGVLRPGSFAVNGMEGYAVRKVDSKGYLNSAVPTQPGYVLCMGSSHTRAWEVPEEKTFTGLLNRYLGGTEENVKAYSVSQSAYSFPAIVKNFKTIIGEFPDSGAIVIETLSSSYSVEALTQALDQPEYNAQKDGDYLFEHQSLPGKLRAMIKDWLPIVPAVKHQIANMKKDDKEAAAAVADQAEVVTEKTLSQAEAEKQLEDETNALDKVLALLRAEYSGKIFIIYHPSVEINRDGTVTVRESDRKATFVELCQENQIQFVDTTESFKEAYAQSYKVPYGFFNTSMGKGHLNAVGHELVAKDLYKALTGGEVE